MSLFVPRTAFKPFEYPEFTAYKQAIHHSFWLVSEWNFTSDVQDFYVRCAPHEQAIIKRTLLAISQIEVSVKRFWSKIGERFPKPEIEQVGIAFGDSETRHADAYSHLLSVLGLQEDFEAVIEEPVIKDRIAYLKKYMTNPRSDEEYTYVLTLFSIFTENVSLFSQFLIIKAFNKYRAIFKDIDNVIQATQQEENVHAMFGFHLIREIQKEHSEWFTVEFYKRLETAARKAEKAEAAIVDWIFGEGGLDFLEKETVKDFIRDRINASLVQLGGSPIFAVDEARVASLSWFKDELLMDVNNDFFHTRPTTYSKMQQAFTAEDLF